MFHKARNEQSAFVDTAEQDWPPLHHRVQHSWTLKKALCLVKSEVFCIEGQTWAFE